MTSNDLNTHRAVVSAVGDGAAYWHPDLMPDSVAIALHSVCSAYRDLLAVKRISRAVFGLPDVRPDAKSALALEVIRKLRPSLTADLEPHEVQAVNVVLLKMLLKCVRLESKTYVVEVSQYMNAYRVIENNRESANLLTMPLHPDRLARL